MEAYDRALVLEQTYRGRYANAALVISMLAQAMQSTTGLQLSTARANMERGKPISMSSRTPLTAAGTFNAVPVMRQSNFVLGRIKDVVHLLDSSLLKQGLNFIPEPSVQGLLGLLALLKRIYQLYVEQPKKIYELVQGVEDATTLADGVKYVVASAISEFLNMIEELGIIRNIQMTLRVIRLVPMIDQKLKNVPREIENTKEVVRSALTAAFGSSSNETEVMALFETTEIVHLMDKIDELLKERPETVEKKLDVNEITSANVELQQMATQTFEQIFEFLQQKIGYEQTVSEEDRERFLAKMEENLLDDSNSMNIKVKVDISADPKIQAATITP